MGNPVSWHHFVGQVIATMKTIVAVVTLSGLLGAEGMPSLRDSNQLKQVRGLNILDAANFIEATYDDDNLALYGSLGWDGYDRYGHVRGSARLQKRFLDPEAWAPVTTSVGNLFSAKLKLFTGIANLFVETINCFLYGTAVGV